MTERVAIGLAALGHILLLGLLSLGLARAFEPSDMAPDVTPVEMVDIADAATVTKMPEPSMAAAPRDAGAPAAAQMVPDAPLTPVAAAETPDRVSDVAAQDAIAATPAVPVKPQAAPAKRESLDMGALASLIDKALPDAPVKPRDPSGFAKSIEQAIPRGARVSPRQMATLEQAIRAQVAPCWNPPTGGADVAGMTVVLKIRLNRDGSVVGAPEFVSQTGATEGNQAYARAFVETARRAVLRCAPLSLPADMYSYWREFELNFDPRLMT